jgi:hypothetical protein
MNLHGEFVQNCKQKRITGKPKPAGEEVAKHDDFISFGGRNLLVEGNTSIALMKESGCLILSEHVHRPHERNLLLKLRTLCREEPFRENASKSSEKMREQ